MVLASSSYPPISRHPENPRIFLFRGQPTVLVTSAEHYGAVVNRAFDFRAYLDELANWELNATRIYPGALIELAGDFIEGNTLAPLNDNLILPWARSNEPGYVQGGDLFDLDTWDTEFFTRLREFVSTAGELGIVVEVCFFNAQYPERWPIQALFHHNNIQRVGNVDYREFQTQRDAELLARQEAYVREIVVQLQKFDNVIFEVCDEPGLFDTPPEEYHAWISRLVEVVKDAERDMESGHMIAQQVEGNLGEFGDFSEDQRVDLIVGQYIWEEAGKQIGGMQLLERAYHHGKPIELNETAYYPVWYEGDKEAASRVEAWEFMVGGGSSFNQLNGVFTARNPRGESSANERILTSLRALKRFLGAVDLRLARRWNEAFASVPEEVHASCLSDGEQVWLISLHDSVLEGARYRTRDQMRSDLIEILLPAGQYRAAWMRPETGDEVCTQDLAHGGGRLGLKTPAYITDIALQLKRRT